MRDDVISQSFDSLLESEKVRQMGVTTENGHWTRTLFKYTKKKSDILCVRILRFEGSEMDAGHFFWTRPDPTQSLYAVPKSKNCNAIFNRLITNFLQL